MIIITLVTNYSLVLVRDFSVYTTTWEISAIWLAESRGISASFEIPTCKNYTYYGNPKSPNNLLLNRANLPTLLNRHLQDICVLMYKVKHTKMCSETITNIFKPRDSYYNLRNSDFLLPRFNTVSFGKHSLTSFGKHSHT